MAKELNFTENSRGYWEASFSSSGERIAIEVNRKNAGPLIVLGSIDGLKKIMLKDFGPKPNEDLIFEIDVPEEVTVTIISFTEVEDAKATGI